VAQEDPGIESTWRAQPAISVGVLLEEPLAALVDELAILAAELHVAGKLDFLRAEASNEDL